MKNLFLLTLFVTIFLFTCMKEANTIYTDKAYPFDFKGLLKKQTPTIYQYGTHTISNKDKTYAFKKQYNKP